MPRKRPSLGPGEETVGQSQLFVHTDGDAGSNAVDMHARVCAKSDCHGLKRRHSEAFSGKDIQVDFDPKKPRERKGRLEVSKDVANEEDTKERKKKHTKEDTIERGVKYIKKDILEIKKDLIGATKDVENDTNEQSMGNPSHSDVACVNEISDLPSPSPSEQAR